MSEPAWLQHYFLSAGIQFGVVGQPHRQQQCVWKLGLQCVKQSTICVLQGLEEIAQGNFRIKVSWNFRKKEHKQQWDDIYFNVGSAANTCRLVNEDFWSVGFIVDIYKPILGSRQEKKVWDMVNKKKILVYFYMQKELSIYILWFQMYHHSKMNRRSAGTTLSSKKYSVKIATACDEIKIKST